MTAHKSTFVVYKAEGQNVPDLILTAMAPCDTAPNNGPPAHLRTGAYDEVETDRRRAFFREQGREIASALRASLPGGTIDALLVELLQAKASVLGVR